MFIEYKSPFGQAVGVPGGVARVGGKWSTCSWTAVLKGGGKAVLTYALIM